MYRCLRKILMDEKADKKCYETSSILCRKINVLLNLFSILKSNDHCRKKYF